MGPKPRTSSGASARVVAAARLSGESVSQCLCIEVREGHIAKSSGNLIVDETAVREAVRNWMLAPSVEGEKWGNYSVTYRSSN